MPLNNVDVFRAIADQEVIHIKGAFKTEGDSLYNRVSLKHRSDSTVERFKGRLVAKGFAQRYGTDYFETYLPVVRFSSIRALIAFAVQNDMCIHQMAVVTAFLNGD